MLTRGAGSRKDRGATWKSLVSVVSAEPLCGDTSVTILLRRDQDLSRKDCRPRRELRSLPVLVLNFCSFLPEIRCKEVGKPGGILAREDVSEPVPLRLRDSKTPILSFKGEKSCFEAHTPELRDGKRTAYVFDRLILE